MSTISKERSKQIIQQGLDLLNKDEENFIQNAIQSPGALHRQLGIPMDKKIPKGVLKKAAKAKGKLGKRARLAETLAKLRGNR